MKKQQAYVKRKLIKLGKEFEQRDKIIMEPALQHIRMKVKMTIVKPIERREWEKLGRKNKIKEELTRPRKKKIDKKTGKERLTGITEPPEAQRYDKGTGFILKTVPQEKFLKTIEGLNLYLESTYFVT